MLMGSRRRRRTASDALGDDAVDAASPVPFRLDVDASAPVITDIELLRTHRKRNKKKTNDVKECRWFQIKPKDTREKSSRRYEN